jgi:hypothetical protein
VAETIEFIGYVPVFQVLIEVIGGSLTFTVCFSRWLCVYVFCLCVCT